jgi:hypothetical protein
MRVDYRVFRGTWVSWETLFDQVAEFASQIGPRRLINIAHSEARDKEGVVTVWYWAGGEEREMAEEETEPAEPPNRSEHIERRPEF